MYYVWRDFAEVVSVIEYDLTPAIPRKIREAAIPGLAGTPSRLHTAFDPRAKKLYFVDVMTPGGTTIKRVDLAV